MENREFGELRAFATVATELSFSRAAELLGASSSSISAAVRGLETRLGLRLLNRTTRTVALTDAGALLLRRLVPMFAELESIMTDIGELREIPAGVIRLLTPRLAYTDCLEPLIARFLAAYPRVTIDVTIDDSITDLVASRFDIGVRLGEYLQASMTTFPIGEPLRQIPVASQSYLATHGMPLHPTDLHAHRCINWRQQGSVGLYQWEFEKHGEKCAVAVRGPLIINDRSLTIPLALRGVGIALWVEHRLRPFIDDGQLVPLLQDWCPAFPGFYGFYPTQHPLSTAIRTFVDFLGDR